MIREATIQDANQIAKVTVSSWKSTYEGIVSQLFLDGMSLFKYELYWYKNLNEDTAHKNTLVAEDEKGKIIGYIVGGVNRYKEEYPDYDCELYALYIVKNAQGKGIGTALVKALTAILVKEGYQNMIVWVLSQNPSKEFYKQMGGEYLGQKEMNINNECLTETVYGWYNIDESGVGNL